MIAPIERVWTGPPCLVLAHADGAYRGQLGRQLRLLGWEVHEAESASEVRRLARTHRPTVVVLAAEMAGESGWLTCAKLRQQPEAPRVILVHSQPSAEQLRFTQFVGAMALVSQADGVRAVVDAMGVANLPAAG